jgi:hypothetical protein
MRSPERMGFKGKQEIGNMACRDNPEINQIELFR